MPKYTFTFKKDDIFVEFTTEDRDVVERQFQIWVADADEYARSGKVKYQKEKINVQNKETQPNQSFSESIVAADTTKAKEQEPVYEKASSLLKTINAIQSEQLTAESKESTEEIKEEKPEETKIAPEVNDFEAVLEKTIENPTFEPDKSKDQIFLNLVNSKNTTDKFHYLIITAYYLSEFEKLERFSLKQINSKLMQNLSEVIDHTTLQEALNQNLLELVPDLTGISEVGEYKLTNLGEDFFANKI